MDLRLKVWANLAGAWRFDGLDNLATEISLDGLHHNIDLILKGQLKGRVVVNLGE
jgi:hypothetical protein